jgi:hypothetical protein
VTASAQSYGLGNFEYRTREEETDEACPYDLDYNIEDLDARPVFNPVENWLNCKEAILWGLALDEYLVREALSRKICLEGVLDRSASRVPPGLNARDCRVYVMRHGV